MHNRIVVPMGAEFLACLTQMRESQHKFQFFRDLRISEHRAEEHGPNFPRGRNTLWNTHLHAHLELFNRKLCRAAFFFWIFVATRQAIAIEPGRLESLPGSTVLLRVTWRESGVRRPFQGAAGRQSGRQASGMEGRTKQDAEELATSQRNKVFPVAVVVAPENLGKLQVSPEFRLRGLQRLLVERSRRVWQGWARGGRQWRQYSKLKSMAAVEGMGIWRRRNGGGGGGRSTR